MKIKSPIYIENYGKTFADKKEFLAFTNLGKDQSKLLEIDGDDLVFMNVRYPLVNATRANYKKLYYYSTPNIDDKKMRELMANYVLTNNPNTDYQYLQHCLTFATTHIENEYTKTYDPKPVDDYGAFWSGFAGGWLINGGDKHVF